MTWFDKIIPYASSNSKKFKNVDHVETDRHRKKTGRKRRKRESVFVCLCVSVCFCVFSVGVYVCVCVDPSECVTGLNTG